MVCGSESIELSDKILVFDVPPPWFLITAMGVAIAALIVIHVTLCVEACIQRNSKQLLEQTVMREEAPDYYLGEDTKYYTYICAEDAPPPG